MMAAELRIAITLDDYEQALKSDRRTSSHSAPHRLGAR
jgi:hypothetical protein